MKTRTPLRQRLGAPGISLVELLIVMAIVGVLTTGMYTLFLTTSQTYSDQAVNGRMLQNATSAMKRITQDLRGSGTFWAPACAGLLPTAIASTSTTSSLTMVTQLDHLLARTEITANQSQASTIIGVRTVTAPDGSALWAVNDVGYLTDGVQCTRFAVTEVVAGPGLKHVPGNDANSAGGSSYTYPMAASMVCRVLPSQTITYDRDTSDPNVPWLRRNNRRFAPDVTSVSFGYLDGSGATVATPLTAASAATIRAVTVTLQVRGDTVDSSVPGGRRYQWLKSTVQLRNFGS